MFFRRIILTFAAFCLFAGALYASESFQFAFGVGRSGLDSTYKYNVRACARAREALTSVEKNKIIITAYSSPEGKFSRNRQLASLRAGSVKDYILSFISASDSVEVQTVVVPEDWEGVARYLKRSSLEWKEDALSILSSKDGDKKSLLQDLWVGEAWDDLMKNCFPALRRVTVSFAQNASPASQNAVSDNCAIFFKSGSSALTSSPGLSSLAKSNAPYLYIYIKASPEGEEDANRLLSQKRADRIKSRLISLGYQGEIVSVYQGEDWDGLARVVGESTDLPDKDAILDILTDQSLDRTARKRALQALSYGNTWLRLMKEEMSGLRRAVVSPDKQ